MRWKRTAREVDDKIFIQTVLSEDYLFWGACFRECTSTCLATRSAIPVILFYLNIESSHLDDAPRFDRF